MNEAQASSMAAVVYNSSQSTISKYSSERLLSKDTKRKFLSIHGVLSDVDFVELMSLSGPCGKPVKVHEVHDIHEYLNMIALAKLKDKIVSWWKGEESDGTMKWGKVFEGRKKNARRFTILIVICMFMKYGEVFMVMILNLTNKPWLQKWNAGRTRFDSTIETLLFQAIGIVFTFCMQLTLCACYLCFWRDKNHFIFTYIPGMGFVLFFGSMVCFQAFMLVDRFRGCFQRYGDSLVCFFWSSWIIWMIVVAIPMVGYMCCSMQFIWSVREFHWLQEEALFSPHYIQRSLWATRATDAFGVMAFAEIVLMVLRDMGFT